MRMVQTPSSCVVEATVDRLAVGEYCVNVHQLGDLSSGGNRYNRYCAKKMCGKRIVAVEMCIVSLTKCHQLEAWVIFMWIHLARHLYMFIQKS